MNLNALSLLERLISYPSITPKECGIYALVEKIFAQALGENAREVITQEREGVREHICFDSHSFYVSL